MDVRYIFIHKIIISLIDQLLYLKNNKAEESNFIGILFVHQACNKTESIKFQILKELKGVQKKKHPASANIRHFNKYSRLKAYFKS